MIINCTINSKPRSFEVEAQQTLRSMLVLDGHFCVRDSDDCEGFAGSDTVLIDGVPVYANLVLAGEVDGCEIVTPDGLSDKRQLTIVQQAMIDAGIVQSAYNSPAAALLLTWLLNRVSNPTREQIKEALSGIFIRDAGYENYYLAVKLAVEKIATGHYQTQIAPAFRDELRYVGKTMGKVDGPQLVMGERAFVEDRLQEGCCTLKMLRSPYASAYIRSIDTTEAEKVEGVVKIITAFNCPDVYYMSAGQGNPEPSPHDRRLFNYKVRHVGDRVAGVVAETAEAADEAIRLIKVEYEVLKPVFTVEEAMAPGAPAVQGGKAVYLSGQPEGLDKYNEGSDPREGQIVYPFPLHSDSKHNVASSAHGAIGDVKKGFEEADMVIERTYQTSQVQCTPLETHICYSVIDNGRLTLHASTQVPWHLRRIVANVCQIPENKVHVIKERVGGGYGSKQDILVEDACAYATWITGRPVLYHNTRAEEFFANSTRHPMRVTVKMGARKDGRITAIQMDVRANTGPYGNHCLTVPMNACSKTLPLFKVDNMKFDVTTYYTNIPPTGAYQGYGAPKGSYGLMMCMAELASKLGVDYLDMALKNCVTEGYMLEILKGLGEGREGNVVPVGSCGLKEAILKGAQMIEWGKAPVNALGPDWKIGKGFAMIQQGSGLPGLDHSTALAKMATDGTIIVQSGGADIGTGLDTISVKVTSEVLCIDPEFVTVISGDTDSAPFDTGAYASSGTFFSGNASLIAAQNLKEKILAEAALQMEEDKDDLLLEYPGQVVSSRTGKTLLYKDLIHTACSGTGRGQLIAQGSFATKASAVPYGAHFAQVAVNVRTGEIRLQKFYAIQDAGTPINPELALCQMYGAALKSIGHSLYESMILDEKGVCINASFTDYGVPMIAEMPEDFKAVLLDVNDAYGPFGAKSISEIATNGAAPAIGVAIANATGVWIKTWPFTAEKVLRGMGRF
ncbi:MAG: molybdopterin-dependent oxidoreductase Mo/Fe-S-binding subunit [Sphaerochaetaceae bacterium]|jgi:putative selenate reductase molybdopterin-binding subunit|nr:molybdopterin-dependent oxidoreductase Mo/Fe-S-binding subunit [Sphaerochaetaceae bacterium]